MLLPRCQIGNLIRWIDKLAWSWTVTAIMTRPHRVATSLLAFGMLVSAELVELWWNVSYALANPDGRHLRRVIGVNGTWPYNRSLNLRFRAHHCLSDHLHLI